jgi:protein-tyrosine phosphatase
MKPDLYKIKLIGNGFLAVMAKPVTGEWIEYEFLGIANEGINQIVSLLELHEAYTVGLEDEKQLTEKNGMEFVSFPIQDRGLPKSVSEFSRFTKNLYHQVLDGKNTVVHCRAGIGRTGLVAAGILLHHGFNPSAAFELISLKRHVQVPDTDEQCNWLMTNHIEIVGNL